MTAPSSVRFNPDVNTRLSSYVARHPGWTRSSAADRLVDEGLRMDEHPGVIFRDGPAGRRASLVGGPDVWEVIRSVRSARTAEPDLSGPEVTELVSENTGLPARLVGVALTYYAAYPAEVDALVEHTERVEADAVRAADTIAGLLGR